MLYSTLALLALAVPSVYSAPMRAPGKRAESDIVVFTFADVLEQFESAFYAAALNKFQAQDFVNAGFPSAELAAQQFISIQVDESTHSTVLQAALKSFGAEPITSCQFNFDAALTDVATMAATARVVENLGVSAYLGGATLITDPVLLTHAGSIATIEARHSTILNIMSGTGSSVPQAFDMAFTPPEVLAIASPFISGCDLGIPPNPTLNVVNTGSVGPGTKLEFQSAALNDTREGFHCQMLVGGTAFSISLPLDECIVPENINGPVALWITSDDQPLVNNVRDRATNKIIAGPTVAFIDILPQSLGQLARVIPGAAPPPSNGETVSTQTITPEEASAIIAGATTVASATETGAVATATDVAGATATEAAVTDAAATASATDSAAIPEATLGGGSEPVANGAAEPVSSSPNLETGPSADGAINVDGWVNV